MTALSGLISRVSAEINDATNNTFGSSIVGTNFTELQSYAVDGIKDYAHYVYREGFASSIITSANTRSYVVSGLSPAPVLIHRCEYVITSTNIVNVPEIELWNNTMYLFENDKPLFTQADKYFNIWYYAEHDIPSAGSATITVPTNDEELIVLYTKAKAMHKYALDQRGLNQDSSNEFLNLATTFERQYRQGINKLQTTFIGYKG